MLQGNISDEAIFKKSSFILFPFSLNQFVGSECKRLCSYQLLALLGIIINFIFFITINFILHITDINVDNSSAWLIRCSSLQFLGSVIWILRPAGIRACCPFIPCCASFILTSININGIICEISETSSGHRSSTSSISGQCPKPLYELTLAFYFFSWT